MIATPDVPKYHGRESFAAYFEVLKTAMDTDAVHLPKLFVAGPIKRVGHLIIYIVLHFCWINWLLFFSSTLAPITSSKASMIRIGVSDRRSLCRCQVIACSFLLYCRFLPRGKCVKAKGRRQISGNSNITVKRKLGWRWQLAWDWCARLLNCMTWASFIASSLPGTSWYRCRLHWTPLRKRWSLWTWAWQRDGHHRSGNTNWDKTKAWFNQWIMVKKAFLHRNQFVPLAGTIKYSSKRTLTRHNVGPADDFISVIYIVAELISGK